MTDKTRQDKIRDNKKAREDTVRQENLNFTIKKQQQCSELQGLQAESGIYYYTVPQTSLASAFLYDKGENNGDNIEQPKYQTCTCTYVLHT